MNIDDQWPNPPFSAYPVFSLWKFLQPRASNPCTFFKHLRETPYSCTFRDVVHALVHLCVSVSYLGPSFSNCTKHMELTLAPHASTFAAPSQSFLGLLSRSAAVYIVNVHVEIGKNTRLGTGFKIEFRNPNRKPEVRNLARKTEITTTFLPRRMSPCETYGQ